MVKSNSVVQVILRTHAQTSQPEADETDDPRPLSYHKGKFHLGLSFYAYVRQGPGPATFQIQESRPWKSPSLWHHGHAWVHYINSTNP